MPGKRRPQTCTRCVPARTVHSAQQFNQHVLSRHSREPNFNLRDFQAMMDGTYLICPESTCMCPLYGANSHNRHYVEHHPATAAPVLPDLVPSTTALIRADRRERSAYRTNNNNNANAVIAVAPNAATTQPAQFIPPTPVAVADTTTIASVTTSNSTRRNTTTRSPVRTRARTRTSITSTSRSTTTALGASSRLTANHDAATENEDDHDDAMSSTSLPASQASLSAPTRSATDITNIPDSSSSSATASADNHQGTITNINSTTNNVRTNVLLLPTDASSTSSTAPMQQRRRSPRTNNTNTATNDATPAMNNVSNTRNSNNRNQRRTPTSVHVNHLPPNNIPAMLDAGENDADIRQEDADLAIRRRNNITRRNNRRQILHGNYDLLPSTVEDLNINDDYELELLNMPDADFEEHFFGFHHPRLDTIHYSYVTSIQALVVKLLRIIIENSVAAIPDDNNNNDAIKICRSAITALYCLIMIIRCIIIKKEANHTSDNVKQFLNHWNDLPAPEVVPSILFYASKAAAFARAAEYRPRVYHSVQSVLEVANKYMDQNKYSRAISLIDQQFTRLNILNENNDDIINDNTMTTPIARWSQEEIRQMTDDLHPTRDAILDDVNVNATITNHNVDAPPPQRININDKDILEVVKQLDSTSSEGVDAWNNFHLKKIILHIDNAGEANAAATHNELLSLLAQLSQYFVAGTFNNATLWTMSRIIYIEKPNSNKYRPIAIGSAIYRLLADSILQQVVVATGTILSPIQIGVGIKDGSSIIASTLKSLTNLNDDLCILSFDLENAFNTERRGRTAAGVAQFCPALLKLYQALYGIEFSSLRTSLGILAGRSCTGVRQGDPLAMLFFCCSIQETLIEINNKLKSTMAEPAAGNRSTLFKLYIQASYADDLNICLPVNFAEEIFNETMNIFEHRNFRLNRAKSTIFLSGRYRDDDDLVQTHFPTTFERVVYKTKILGVTFGSDEDVQQSLLANVTEIKRLAALLKHVPAHVAFYLVKYCINATASYLHRIHKPSVTQASYSRQVDDAIIEAIEHMVQSSLSMESRALVRFPCKFDGIGINAWHSFIPKLQYDLVQYRTVTYLHSHIAVYGNNILNVVRRDREHFDDAELGFNANIARDYVNLSSSTRSHTRYTSLHKEFRELLLSRNRQDVVAHMEHQHFRASGLLFGMSYIRKSFIKDHSYFGEALAYRLKVPLIVAPPPDPDIPPPRPYYHCQLCDRYGRYYDHNTTLFEHCMLCHGNSAEKTHRHDATVKAIMNYVRDCRGDAVEVIVGDRENTNGDRGQICDFVIRSRGRADVKFDVTYTTAGVDASQSTNPLLPAPLASIVIAENGKRSHYQRNDNSAGDVIPLAFSSSGYYFGPSFIAFCNTIEASEANAQVVYDYAAHNGIQFIKNFHPARRRLISEITRFCYVFIAKARIRNRQQVYRHDSMAGQNSNGNVVGHHGPPPLFHHSQQTAWPPTSGGQPLVA